MADDHLRVRGMIFHAYHGLEHDEIKNGQRFEVDVDLTLDVSKAGQSDHLRDTVDVRAIYDLVHGVVVKGRFFLIEAVGERIAESILARFPVAEVVVTVRKPFAPLGGLADGTEVEITRRPAGGS